MDRLDAMRQSRLLTRSAAELCWSDSVTSRSLCLGRMSLASTCSAAPPLLREEQGEEVAWQPPRKSRWWTKTTLPGVSVRVSARDKLWGSMRYLSVMTTPAGCDGVQTRCRTKLLFKNDLYERYVAALTSDDGLAFKGEPEPGAEI